MRASIILIRKPHQEGGHVLVLLTVRSFFAHAVMSLTIGLQVVRLTSHAGQRDFFITWSCNGGHRVGWSKPGCLDYQRSADIDRRKVSQPLI